MKGGVYLHIGGNQTAAHLYDVVIRKGAVHIHFTAVTEMYILAVIRIKRGSYPQIFPRLPGRRDKISSFAAGSADGVRLYCLAGPFAGCRRLGSRLPEQS